MSHELNIAKNVKDMNDHEKEVLRLQLEKKLQEYMKENYDIFYPTFVRYPYPSMKDTVDFMIGIVFNQNYYGSDIVYRTVRSYVENLSKDIKFYVETITYGRYYHDMFDNIVSKKTLPVNSKWFDVNEGAFSDKDIKINTSVFIYKYNKLFLNVGYIEYEDAHQDITRYYNRKLFPLLDFNIDKFVRLRYIYDELKNANDYISDEDYTIKQYLNALDNYINNEIDIDKLYDSLNQIEPKLLFFFNYLFVKNTIKDPAYHYSWKHEEINIVDNDKINFSYREMFSYREIFPRSRYAVVNMLLSFNKDMNEIGVAINYYDKSDHYSFAAKDSVMTYEHHVENIKKKLKVLIESVNISDPEINRNENQVNEKSSGDIEDEVSEEMEEEISESKSPRDVKTR